MKVLRFYDPQTGLFDGRTLRASDDVDVEANTPAGLVAIEGEHDILSKRVDLKTGEVVDYQPPQPSDDHQWDDQVKRWALKPDVLDAQATAAEAMVEIKIQEAGSLRALRELILNPDNTEARAKLQEVDDAIAAERPKIIVRGQPVEQPAPVDDLEAAP